jgi:hypothetical protein
MGLFSSYVEVTIYIHCASVCILHSAAVRISGFVYRLPINTYCSNNNIAICTAPRVLLMAAIGMNVYSMRRRTVVPHSQTTIPVL